MPSHISLNPKELSQDDAYNVLVAAVTPRPIALVSTVSADGVANLAPFSFFMAGGVSPLSVAFSPTDGPRGPKNSLTNILATKEFVINTVHREMAEGMNEASFGYGPDVSEWRLAGFTMVPSDDVKPPRVAESLVQLECRLFQSIKHGSGAGASNYVIGEVVRIHINSSLWSSKGIEMEKLRLLARMGGPNYLDTNALEIFELQRPSGPVPEES